MASRILRRVASANAFDIFSTSERSMVNLECSERIGIVARENPVPVQANPRKAATDYFNDHPNV
jgi:hypothetical protein